MIECIGAPRNAINGSRLRRGLAGVSLRDNFPIMKTASVIELRNNFASVSRWIYEGESVTIQKRGRPFAILSPVAKKKKAVLDWPDFEMRLQRQFPNASTKGSARDIVDEMRGNY